MKTQIYLEKRLKVIISSSSKQSNKLLVGTIGKNLESLGYIFTKPLFNKLCKLNEDELTSFYREIVPVLKKMRGAHREFNPMYPNFPQQVLDMSKFELYFNALLHYWTNELPEYDKEERVPTTESVKLDAIDLGSEEDFESIFPTLLSANTSLSQSDKDILEWFVQHKFELPESIPQKENLCFLVGKVLLYKPYLAGRLNTFIKTPTDVLRIATSLSGGDVSLAENVKFRKFKRFERLFLVSLLRDCTCDLAADMVKYKNRWIRLGEIIHPGEFNYPKVKEAFRKIRNNEHIETFNSSVESAIKVSPTKAANLLKVRPGDFARRLDHLLRLSVNRKKNLADAFLTVADKVSTPVLLQLYSHFKNRDEVHDRAIFPKGNLAKIQVLPGHPEFSSTFCNYFSGEIRKVLVDRFSELPRLGKVYLDENLKNYLVPFSQRSASKALKTLVRGSKIDLDGDYDTIRFFVWWKNGRGERTDLDLSAVMLGEDWSYKNVISYYNLKDFGGHHSGDIVDAPKGASEFIDISLSQVLKSGSRYIGMCVNSYTEQPYCDLPECFAGWMGREKPNSGEIYEPKTVKNKVDITANTKIAIPMVIDCLERKVIWCDLSLKKSPIWNNVQNNKGNIALVCKAMANLKKVNLYDLFSMHIEGRGKLVKQEKAEVVFSTEKAMEIDEICSKYL